MSKTVVAPGERLGADAVPPQSPPDLLDLLRTGAVIAGDVVSEVVILTASGRRQRLQLPTPKGRQAATGLSRSKQKLLDVLRASSVPLTRLAAAHRCGLEDSTGRFGLNVKAMLADELIFSNGEEITDDAAKFE